MGSLFFCSVDVPHLAGVAHLKCRDCNSALSKT